MVIDQTQMGGQLVVIGLLNLKLILLAPRKIGAFFKENKSNCLMLRLSMFLLNKCEAYISKTLGIFYIGAPKAVW